MRLISGGAELKEKWQRTIASFTQNFDQDDPEFMSLRDAFMERFKEHGFVIDSIAKFNEETQALDEIITRLQDLQKRNNAIVRIDDYFFEHKEFLLNSTWNYNERRLF